VAGRAQAQQLLHLLVELAHRQAGHGRLRGGRSQPS
jgi:hypothetical protein